MLLLLLAQLQASPVRPARPLRAEEARFLDRVTCTAADGASAAARLFSEYGVVRVLGAAADADAWLREATVAGVESDAFAQPSRRARFALRLRGDARAWRGDGTDAVGDSRCPHALRTLAPTLAAFLDDGLWRRVARATPTVALAEVVVAEPGGAAQPWHYDGVGATAQVALVDVGPENGPTELVPRPLPPAVVAGRRRARAAYDVATLARRLAWVVLRAVGADAPSVAPATVRLVAPRGALVVYDAAMLHRGGHNLSGARRPILALHLRAGDGG